MDLNNLTIFQMANKELNYLTERQKVLAANLANSNTPGYVAKEILCHILLPERQKPCRDYDFLSNACIDFVPDFSKK